jgi:hypothetical protein
VEAPVQTCEEEILTDEEARQVPERATVSLRASPAEAPVQVRKEGILTAEELEPLPLPTPTAEVPLPVCQKEIVTDEEPPPEPDPIVRAVPRLSMKDLAEDVAASALLEGSEGDSAPATPSPELLQLWRLMGESQPKETEPPKVLKECNVKLCCPNCGSQGNFPWGRLDHLLCCSHCWSWYRLGANGKLDEVPAPKNFVLGTLRGYKENGRTQTVDVTVSDIKRKRSQVQTRATIEAVRSLNICDKLVLRAAGLYTVGLLIFGFWAAFSVNLHKPAAKRPAAPAVNVGVRRPQAKPVAKSSEAKAETKMARARRPLPPPKK